MSPQYNMYTVLFILLCSISMTSCKLEEKFKNVLIEFETQKVPFGIIDKFEKFFENVPDTPQAQQKELDDESEDEEYSEEYELEDVENPEVELTKIIDTSKSGSSADPMSKDYENLINKLCLFTALSKEATIFATSNVRI
jgi:hypothetical protein